MGCEDRIRDKVTSTTTAEDMSKYRAQIEACAVKCADEHCDLIPGLTKKMIDNLSKGSF